MNHKTWPLCEKCPCSELFSGANFFSRIWTEYEDLQSKFPYSLRMWRNTGQANSEYKHFSCSWRQNIASLF